MKDTLKAIVFVAIFAVPFLTLYVESDYFFPFITGKNFGFRILVDIAFAAWALLALLDGKYRPRMSWVLGSFGVLLGVMFFANLLGEHPTSSFWSNFERMDGYVSLVHTFMYALVVGSVLKTKQQWQYLLGTSMFVATLVALYGLAQYGGVIDGSSRIDSRLGNAAYMAVYMLFHIFIAFWLFVETKKPFQKTVFLLLAAMFTFVLIETGTRGTAVGLAVGVVTMAGYISLFGREYKEIRKYAIGVLAVLAVAVAGFVIGRDTAFVQDNPNLSRIANISLEDLTVRSSIWTLAWQGFQDRPILGWGQSNFNYVFNEYYDPSLYDQEQWFDRAHNIVFDWVIAGGILGFLAYASIFVACLWYLFIRPLINPKDESFTVLERGVLLGILAGYLTHNLVVFDNIVSYIFFAMLLGLIHSRVATPIGNIEQKKISEDVVAQVATPVVVVLLGSVIYFAHLPGMLTAADIITAVRTPDPTERLEIFERAIERDTFARQELTEQLAQQAISLARDPNVTPETRQAFAAYAEEQLLNLAAFKPGDARIHVFIGSFYRSFSQLEQAAEQFAIARGLSPQKQSIIFQQGLVAISQERYAEAVDFFQTAYELAPSNLIAREYYAASLMYTGDTETIEVLMDTPAAERQIAFSDFVANSANQAEEYAFLATLFERRVASNPNDAQVWATLAFVYYQADQNAEALRVLDEASVAVPAFSETAACFSQNIESGQDPQIGCN
jgi:O-antigen ligase/tetratricopeptide (TPR) repeat protein